MKHERFHKKYKECCGNCHWFDRVWHRCANFAGHRRGDFVGTSEWCLNWKKIEESVGEKEEYGRWIVGDYCNHVPYRIKHPEKWVIYKCSVCGYSNGRKQSDYCPSCGADMRGDGNE